jgi:hypothetical protein
MPMLFVLAALAAVALMTVGVLFPLIDRAIGAVPGSAEAGPIHTARLSEAASRLLVGRGGPTIVAVLFALLSLPIVALSLGVVDTTGDAFFFESKSATALGQWSAASSVLNYADLVFYFSPFFEPVPTVTLIVGVGLWTPIVRFTYSLGGWAGRAFCHRPLSPAP